MQYQIHHGDNREVLKNLADNSIDSVVTDPPYELGFMGKSWDATGVAYSVELWQEVMRVLKPGGHLLAFSGSRTYHRMAVAIEDAGFEIRDQIMWIYGSGFPKSLDVSKAIDKVNGEPNRLLKFTSWMRTTGLKAKDIDAVLRSHNLISQTSNMAVHFFNDGQPQIATAAMWAVVRPMIEIEIPHWVDELVQRIEAEREVVGKGSSTLINATGTYAVTNGEAGEEWKPKEYDITAPATAEAKQWQGWGTALKPAHEPIVVARKPLIGTVAANVLTYGTGGLNIDASRVSSSDNFDGIKGFASMKLNARRNGESLEEWKLRCESGPEQQESLRKLQELGRWPANVIHDGSDEVVELFPETAPSKAAARGGTNPNPMDWGNKRLDGNVIKGHNDIGGSAARFFYCAKASKRDRNEGLDGFEAKRDHDGRQEGGVGGSNPRNRTNTAKINHHPTVKPTELMRYLCRLVTPPSGTVLDPFMGSGSTGKAAIYEGFNFVGIEMTDEYIPIAKARIEFAIEEMKGRLL